MVELRDENGNIVDDIEQGAEDVDGEIPSTPNPVDLPEHADGPSPNSCSPTKRLLVYSRRKQDKTFLVYSRRKILKQDHGEVPPNPPGNVEVGKRWTRDWDTMLPENLGKCQKIDKLMNLRPKSSLRPPNKYTPTFKKVQHCLLFLHVY